MILDRDFLAALSSDRVDAWFARDYAASRVRFMQYCAPLAAESRKWALDGDAALNTDALWIGDRQADNVLVVISGTHGVEGYCGSAAQAFIGHCLSGGQLRLPDDTALLLIHALNPWGMQWARRCDRDGIDINRNFVDFADLPVPDSRYPQLLDALCRDTPQGRREALQALSAAWGQADFDRCFSGGQYHCHWAPFYGGSAPGAASRVIDSVIDQWQLQERCLVVIDLHSGLGPWAFGELISDHPADSNGHLFARRLFGGAVAATAEGDSFSVAKQGLLDYRWHRLMAQRGCFLTLEFGTRGTTGLFDVLLEEHLFWQRNPAPGFTDCGYAAQRGAMLDHFNPRDRLWQQAVLFKTWQVVERLFSQDWQ